MNYYFSTTIACSFDEGIKRATESLKSEGFGIISEIRLHEKFKEKLDVDFKKYTILGACNPSYAYKAVQMEDKIGTMLPCNVLVIEQGISNTEIAIVNPIASMQAILNPDLEAVALQVSQKLQKVAQSLSSNSK